MHVGALSLVTFLIVFSLNSFAADITLVKHARRVTQQGPSQYLVREGDTLRRILMEAYNAKEEDLPGLYRRFRQNNPNITNLDHIPSGTRIIIPIQGEADSVAPEKKPVAGIEVKEVSVDEYVIKQGEHLAKILRKVYGVSDEIIFREYIDMVKKLNPEISDPNLIKAGQKLRLPEIKKVLAKAKNAKEAAASAAKTQAAGIEQQGGMQNRTSAQSDAPRQDKQVETAPVPDQSMKAASEPDIRPKTATQAASNGKSGVAGGEKDLKMVKGAVLPALKSMGGTKRDRGMYYMPTPGGTSLSINTSEIPVMELDTGKKIIFDMNGTITPEVRAYIEKAFPTFTVVSGSQPDLESLMDRVLSVSGYFSINKDSSPLLVGSEEKLRFFGKWIVYKDFSRKDVYVLNLLDKDDRKTPGAIRAYAKHFGINLIEIGGKDALGVAQKKPVQVVDLRQSYTALLTRLRIPFEKDKEIDLIKSGVVRITYKAPVLIGNKVLTDVAPDQDMAEMLRDRSYEIIDVNAAKPDEVLKALGLEYEGPPLKMTIAQGRTELEIPGMRMGGSVVLLRKIDSDITAYLAASGVKVLAW